MYFLTACLIVVVVSAQVSSRRSWYLLRDAQLASPARRLAARRRAILPIFYVGGSLFLVLLLGRVLGPEFGAATTEVLGVLVSILAGSFIGVFGVIAAIDPR
jgi:hypothetical protein